jgi:hypothetical protein
MAEGRLFSRPVIFALSASMMVALALSFWLQLRGGSEEVIVQPSTYSRSAIGHAALYETLRRLDLPVARSRLGAVEGLGVGGVLVLAEPDISTMIRNFDMGHAAQTLLLVLPKRQGTRDLRRPDWIGDTRLLSPALVRGLLNLFVSRAEVVHVPSPKRWTVNRLGASPALADTVQLVRGGAITPIVATDAGTLVGEIRDGNRRILILSDPDPIENYAIAIDSNAAFVVALLGALRRGDGRIVFDETVHGLAGAATSPLNLLFRFPYILVTFQLLVALGLLFLAATTRFGAEEPLPPPIGFGKASLIENSAALLDRAAHRADILRRYLKMMLRETGRRLRAPADLDESALAQWLDPLGATRGLVLNASQIMRRADETPRGSAWELASLAAAARDMHAWNGEISNGTSARKDGR